MSTFKRFANTSSPLQSSIPRIHFKKYGTGTKKIVAFHGFGQSAELFASWAYALPDYEIYSIDLFFHGESDWFPEHLLLLPSEWKRIFESFLKQEGIEKFSLLAFSLGGRVAMLTFTLFPEYVEGFWLNAPDGFRTNFWYQYSTGLRSIRYFFRMSVEKPFIFEGLRRLVEKTGMVNKSLVRLASKQMESRYLRWRVYATWMTYRLFKTDTRKLINEINRRKIPVFLFGGKFDRLILPHFLQKIASKIQMCQYREFDCGHFKLPEVVAQTLREEINHQKNAK